MNRNVKLHLSCKVTIICIVFLGPHSLPLKMPHWNLDFSQGLFIELVLNPEYSLYKRYSPNVKLSQQKQIVSVLSLCSVFFPSEP